MNRGQQRPPAADRPSVRAALHTFVPARDGRTYPRYASASVSAPARRRAPGWGDESLTEAEWLTGADPKRMLDWLYAGRDRRATGPFSWLLFPRSRPVFRASDRKLRLFACACCRRVWDQIDYGSSRHAVQVGEWFADGLVGREELFDARARAWEAHARAWRRDGQDHWLLQAAAYAVEEATWASWSAALSVQLACTDEAEAQCGLLRDLFGNPFRPVALDPAWLSWNGGTIPKLVRSLYAEGRFADLPVLADALEEAGCADEAILSHCRSAAGHVRGCWVVDLLLGNA